MLTTRPLVVGAALRSAPAWAEPSEGEPPPQEGERSGWVEHLRVRGGVDAFVGLDRPSREDHRRPPFFYNYARTSGVSINLARLGAELDHDDIRGAVTAMAGTFAQDNQGFEEPGLRNLYEARVGLRLAGSTWLDAGLFPSHLGAESAIGLESPTLTRSLTAENSPYYLAGVKLETAPHDDVELGVLLANGWQTIRQPRGSPGFGGGTWVTVRPTAGLTLNWSTWVGLDQPSAAVRLFNDLYAVLTVGRLELIGWLDVGALDGRLWGGGNVQARLRVSETLRLSWRAEHFADPHAAALAEPARLTGGSVGVDLLQQAIIGRDTALAGWRIELRGLRADRPVFEDSPWYLAATTGLGLTF